MKAILAGLFVLGTLSISFAQEIIIKDKGKSFNKLLTGNQEEALRSVYSKYDLDPSMEYLVVYTNQHPGLLCTNATQLVKDGKFENDVDITFDMDKTGVTYLIPNLNGSKTAYLSMVCRGVDYVTNDNERVSGSLAFKNSIDAVIITRHTVTKKEVRSFDNRLYTFSLQFKNGPWYE